MLRITPDLPDPRDPVENARGDLADPMSGVAIPRGLVTVIAADDPVDAVALADRLGRYSEGAELGGVPLKDLRLAAVRERILVADNDARLFSGELRADLDPVPRGRLAAALEAASATDIVDGLPHGMASRVAERGRTFSGGQQQRLRLARALAADPEILVLVEPTSAVDAHTEARIAARLGTAREGRTTVICSTSPLVLDHADHVVYLENGRAVAAGTHHELLRSEPGYARTVLREEDA
jgi:ABC-type multidrug transport system fused ATPase/permease subunit